MAADGSVVFSVDLDDKDAQKELNKLVKKIDTLNDKIYQKQQDKMPLAKQSAEIAAKSRSHVGGSKPHLCRYSTTRSLICCYGSRLCTVRFVASSHMPSEQVSLTYSRSFPQ